MLVLSRKLGESILIEGMRVKVVKIENNQVKLGFDAPRDVRIMRAELVDARPATPPPAEAGRMIDA